VIVVIGNLVGRIDEVHGIEPAGFVAIIASAAAEGGSQVQVVARVGDDSVGDAVLLGLASRHVGHVATLRDAGRRTPLLHSAEDPADDAEPSEGDVAAFDDATLDAADVGLALRYLTDYRVIVIAHMLDGALIREAVSATSWAGGHLIVVTPPDVTLDAPVPVDALVLSAAPDAEAIASRLGRYAAAVDAGRDLDRAYAALTASNT
jgi:sugar/nucleoside kinase (ribokinase family)